MLAGEKTLHVTLSGTEIRANGTMTPPVGEDRSAVLNDIDMDPQEHIDCPCGYLHGPGSGTHDISAVGFSANMMRGPD